MASKRKEAQRRRTALLPQQIPVLSEGTTLGTGTGGNPALSGCFPGISSFNTVIRCGGTARRPGSRQEEQASQTGHGFLLKAQLPDGGAEI